MGSRMIASERLFHLKRAWWTRKGVRRRLMHLRLAAGLRRVMVRVPHGRLRVDLCDQGGLGRLLYFTGEYEQAETVAFSRLVEKGSIVLDVGANIGYFATFFAQRAAHVYAIEPTPSTLALLRENVSAYSNVTVLPVAVSDQPGTMSLWIDDRNAGDNTLYEQPGRRSVTVPVTTVDALVRELQIPRVDLIKIDIQGAEVAAFRGMRETLRSNPHAPIVAEFWKQGLRRAGVDVDEWLDAIGPAEYSRIAQDGSEERIAVGWFHQQSETHYESVVVRRRSASS